MLQNLGSVWFRTFVTIVVLFISKNFVATELGLAANDEWVELNALVGFLALVAAGVPMSTTRQVARRRAVDDRAGLERTIGSSMAIYLGLGVAAALLGALLFPLYADKFLDPAVTSALVIDDATVGYLLLVLYGAVTFSAQLHYGVFNGHQDFVSPNLILTASLVFKLILFLVLIPIWPSVSTCCGIALFVVMVEWITGRIVIRIRRPDVRLRLSSARRDEVREIATFSLYALLLNLGIKLSFMSNLLVIGDVRDVKGEATLYEAASTPIMYLLEPVIAVGLVMMPKVAAWKEREGDPREFRDSFLVWARVCTLLGLAPLTWLSIQAGPFLARWMDEPVAEAGPELAHEAGLAMSLLAIGTILFLPARGLAMSVLMGLGCKKAPSSLFLGAGVLNVVLAYAFVPDHGVMGAAAATATSTTLLALSLMGLAIRELSLDPWETFAYVFVRPLIAAGIAAGVLWAWAHERVAQSWTELVVSGIVTVGLFTVLALALAVRGDRRMPLHRLPRSIGRWLGASRD